MKQLIKILIIEDEVLAAKRLERLLMETDFNIEIVMKCASVKDSVQYLSSKPPLDLLMMDIRLGDGVSLDILDQIDIDIPIIFTTAYDQYSLKAFKLQSIDYLLKPIDIEELKAAIAKFIKIYQSPQETSSAAISAKPISKAVRFKERFLIKTGNHLKVVSITDVHYFYTLDGYTHITTSNGKKYLIDETIEMVQKMVDPDIFFRINRAMIVHINSLDKMETYFNSRFSLTLTPPFTEQVIVARERVKEFKEWIER